MLKIKTTGSFDRTKKFLDYVKRNAMFDALEEYGRRGVSALASATPVETGRTASSWTYEVTRKNGAYSIEWKNTNVVNGTNIAIILQYGHGTGTGGWVQGRDYINPAIQPVMDKIANEVWEKVKRG